MQANLRAFGVEDCVEVVRKYSTEAAKDWNRPIDMLFIDGDHTYEGVKNDWSLFVPHVTEFGIVVFHDTIWGLRPPSPRMAKELGARQMGVPRFVDELRAAGYPTITIPQHFGITMVQPVKGGIPLTR
jgi:predicted O-methyltransferase YrrM